MSLPLPRQAATIVLMDPATGLNLSLLALVEKVEDQGTMLLGTLFPEAPVLPAIGSRVALMYGREGQAWMAVCVVASVAGERGPDGLLLVGLDPPRRTYPINRRSSARARVELSVRFRTTELPEPQETPEGPWLALRERLQADALDQDGFTRDIGVGGASVYTPTTLGQGEGVLMQVELPGRLVGVAGRCVSERPLNGVHQGSRCFAFQFLDLQGPDLDYLSRFVLEWDVEHKLLDPGA